MKKLLLPIFLLAQFIGFAPGVVVRGQATPTPAGATQAATPAARQADAVKEADSLSLQIVQLYEAGKFDEALPLAERALKLREEADGREHQSVAQALRNLGAIYHSKSKLDKARQLYKRALSIYEKNPTPNRTNIYNLLDALGILERFAFNNFTAAIENYERSLALKQSSLGAEHEDVIKTLYELAELYELLGRNDKALATHRRLIGIMEKREATKPDDLILALNRFVCLSERLKMKTETAEAERRVEEIMAREEAKREQETKEALPGVQISGGELVQSGMINGRAISKPQPHYPAEAKRLRISGTVKIFVIVDETGRVIEAYPCGHPLLSEAALRAAYRARFTPPLLDGKPVKVTGFITYNFVLQ